MRFLRQYQTSQTPHKIWDSASTSPHGKRAPQAPGPNPLIFAGEDPFLFLVRSL